MYLLPPFKSHIISKKGTKIMLCILLTWEYKLKTVIECRQKLVQNRFFIHQKIYDEFSEDAMSKKNLHIIYIIKMQVCNTINIVMNEDRICERNIMYFKCQKIYTK